VRGVIGPPYREAAALLAVAGRRTDVAAYLRAKAHMAGIRNDTDLRTACDVFLALEVDGVPGKELTEWRQRLDQQLSKSVAPNRDTWGALPEQVAATSKLTGPSKPRRAPKPAGPVPRGGVSLPPG
jgi:hypothetical protein